MRAISLNPVVLRDLLIKDGALTRSKELRDLVGERIATETNLEPGYKNIYPALSFPGNEVDTFEAVHLPKNDALYVDEEGLLRDPEFWMTVKGFPNPLAGRGLIVGTDTDGNSTDAQSSLDWVLDNVWFGYHNLHWSRDTGLVVLDRFCVRHWGEKTSWLRI